MALDEGLAAEAEAGGDASERMIAEWIQARLGGQVTRIERQGRWRPAWFVDVVKDGALRQLYVRGARGGSSAYSLEREYHIHRLLQEGGVRTPPLHGYIEDLPGMVMDFIPGNSDLGVASESDRQAVRAQLVEQMALMHDLDVAPFHEIGLRLPETPRGVTLSFFDDLHGLYRARKPRPDPGLEFLSRWILRNAPVSDGPPRYTACDAGQFLFEGSRLTAMMDFELSVLADPMMDLAALRVRSQWEYLGDLPSLYALYAQRTGRKIDLQMIRFQTAAFSLGGALGSSLQVAHFLADPQPDVDYVEYVSWVVWLVKQAYEGAAEYLGLTLPPFKAPDARRTWLDEPLFALRHSVDAQPAGGEVEAYRKRSRQTIVTYLDRVAAYGAQLEADYVRDAGELLGRSIENGEEADALLDAYVQTASPDEDERLLRLLHANVSRQAFLLATPGARYTNGLIKPLIPVH